MVNKNFLVQFLFNNIKDPYSNENIKDKGIIQRYFYNNVDKNNIIQPRLYKAIDFEFDTILYKVILNIIDSFINYKREFYIILCTNYYNHTLDNCVFFNNYSKCYNKFLEFKGNKTLNRDVILFQSDSDIIPKKITKRNHGKFYNNLKIINYNTSNGSNYIPHKIHLINPTMINYNNNFVFIKNINGRNIYFDNLEEVYFDFLKTYKYITYNYFYTKINLNKKILIISKREKDILIKLPMSMNQLNGYYLFNKLF